MAERKSSKLMRLATINSSLGHLQDEYDYIFMNSDGICLNAYQCNIIRILSQGLGIPLEVVIAEDNAFGLKLPDGNWTGIMGMLVRGEADISITEMTISTERREAVNFTYPLRVGEFTFKTNKPKPYPRNSAILETFSSEVWICIVISLILVSTLLYILLKRKQTYSTILLETVGNLLEKSFSFEVRKRNTVFLLITWFLGVTVLANSYRAVVLSVITLPRMVGIRDISDLSKAVKDSSFRCITVKGAASTIAWFESDDDRLRAIGECIKISEIENLYNMAAFVKYPHKKAFIVDRNVIGEFDKNYFISEDRFSISFTGIAYTKSFCCPRKLEKVVRYIVEAGLYQKYLRDKKFRKQLRQPPLENSDYDNTHVMPLSLKDLTGAFLVLFFGYLLSLVILIIETILQKIIIMKNCETKVFIF